jgi:hypothetical protein
LLLMQMRLHHYSFVAEWLPEHSDQPFCSSDLSNKSCKQCLPITVVSITQAESASTATLTGTVYHFGDCAYHPARFVIFAQLTHNCIFFVVFLVLHSLLIIGTCTIAPTISNRIT